jgi:hypothetical protein
MPTDGTYFHIFNPSASCRRSAIAYIRLATYFSVTPRGALIICWLMSCRTSSKFLFLCSVSAVIALGICHGLPSAIVLRTAARSGSQPDETFPKYTGKDAIFLGAFEGIAQQHELLEQDLLVACAWTERPALQPPRGPDDAHPAAPARRLCTRQKIHV